MLVGHEIGLSEIFWISVFGMAVATIAIILLMFFVIILSKVVAQGSNNAVAEVSPACKSESPHQSSAAAPLPNAAWLSPHDIFVSEEEIAAISASLCAETGMTPNHFRIVSIISKP